jgi:hypothetical protein
MVPVRINSAPLLTSPRWGEELKVIPSLGGGIEGNSPAPSGGGLGWGVPFLSLPRPPLLSPRARSRGVVTDMLHNGSHSHQFRPPPNLPPLGGGIEGDSLAGGRSCG